MRSKLKNSLNDLQQSDIYSLLLYLLYKVKDVPEYAELSELCYLLDGNNLIRLLTYFAGSTLTVPSVEDFVIATNALLLYQYINIDKMSLVDAQERLEDVTGKQKEKITELYLKIIPIINQYNVDRGNLKRSI